MIVILASPGYAVGQVFVSCDPFAMRIQLHGKTAFEPR